jgi:hypothetical protein
MIGINNIKAYPTKRQPETPHLSPDSDSSQTMLRRNPKGTIDIFLP